MVTPVYAPLVRHRWDNIARLKALRDLGGVRIAALHGVQDSDIPVSMSRELAQLFPEMIALEELPGWGHNDVFYGASDTILQKVAAFSSPGR